MEKAMANLRIVAVLRLLLHPLPQQSDRRQRENQRCSY
jgi:hypothetical protein